MDEKFISIVGLNHYFGVEIFNVGQILKLKKDYNNKYDGEAIQVEIENIGGKVGYVANSYKTVAKGTRSAGGIYDDFGEYCYCQVAFIVDQTVIAKVLPIQTETKISMEVLAWQILNMKSSNR
ncbi:HIRAN domain-containing protein [Bacillus massiliigorillae]|uniref:HIRAN domain-containing protein n=1 Tax=Bacillus massiliigorillae TaxID=1243664 RepID=UPI00039C1AD6|nr:HIRAN domain-containing protein [Bacillus massiliigorillae]